MDGTGSGSFPIAGSTMVSSKHTSPTHWITKLCGGSLKIQALFSHSSPITLHMPGRKCVYITVLFYVGKISPVIKASQFDSLCFTQFLINVS